jgi:alpha-1,6-mannosyltransferase
VGTRIVQVANFYSRNSGGLRTAVDALGRAYVDAGFERVLVVPGAADADEDTAAGRRITLRAPVLPGSGGYRALPGTAGVRAVLAELPPDHIEVSDKLTLVGLASWAARNGVRAVLVSHERLDAILAPGCRPASRSRRAPTGGTAASRAASTPS